MRPGTGSPLHQYLSPAWAPYPRRGAMDRVVIDPQLRGYLAPRLLGALEARGMAVHRVGHAIYAHDEQRRWILGVWPPGSAPAWSADLDAHHRHLRGRGPATPRQAASHRRYIAAWRRARIRDARGRFVARAPWWYGPDGQPEAGFAPRRRP